MHSAPKQLPVPATRTLCWRPSTLERSREENESIMRQRSILIDGLTIEILDSEGEGLPVFACHGNSSAADSFAGLHNSPLGSRYRNMAISLPGHGASSGYAENESEPGYSIEMLGRLLAKVIEAQECKPYVLIGHSLGGHALLEALDHFHGAAGMMLICAPPIAHEVLGQAFQPDPSAGQLFKEGLSEAEALRLAACFCAGRDKDLLQPMPQRILRTAPGSARRSAPAWLQANSVTSGRSWTPRRSRSPCLPGLRIDSSVQTTSLPSSPTSGGAAGQSGTMVAAMCRTWRPPSASSKCSPNS